MSTIAGALHASAETTMRPLVAPERHQDFRSLAGTPDADASQNPDQGAATDYPQVNSEPSNSGSLGEKQAAMRIKPVLSTSRLVPPGGMTRRSPLSVRDDDVAVTGIGHVKSAGDFIGFNAGQRGLGAENTTVIATAAGGDREQ